MDKRELALGEMRFDKTVRWLPRKPNTLNLKCNLANIVREILYVTFLFLVLNLEREHKFVLEKFRDSA